MRSRLSFVFALALTVLATGMLAQEVGQRSARRARLLDPTPSADGRYVVGLREFNAKAVAAIRSAGGRVALELPKYSAVAAYLPKPAISGLARNPNVAYIEPDPRRYPVSQTTPYGINMVQANLLSDANASDMKVCMIDSGFYTGHEDLPSAGVTGVSLVPGALWDEDGLGHGTHTAGTIVALNNGVGVVGILPNGYLRIHEVRVFGDDGFFYASGLAQALSECQAAGANVVNMSLGGDYPNFTEELAFNDAYDGGVLSVAAAGNGGNGNYFYPASYDSVVSAAAVDGTPIHAGFSQFNDQVELSAPGVQVLSTVPYNEHDTLTVGSQVFQGNWIQNAARSTSGVSGALANGALCTATNTAWNGNVVICERGDISFFDKVMNVQNSGGVAAVIYNNEGINGNFFGTLGDGNSSSIPAISLGKADGQAVVADLIGQAGTVVSWVEEPASGYERWNGTSMATPHVSGVAALVWSHYPNCSNVEIRSALDATAQDLGAAGRDVYFGFGLVQAKAAYDYLQANGCDAGGGGGGGGTGGTPVISNVHSVQGKGPKFNILWLTNIPATSHVLFPCCGFFSDETLVTEHDMGFRGKKRTLYEYWVFSEEFPGGDAAVSGPHYHQN